MTGSDSPKFTLKARQFPNNLGGPDGPGGGKYIPEYDRVLPSSAKPAIRERHRELSTLNPPGPGQYQIDRSPLNRPASFHIKQREFAYDDIPGPGKWDTSKRTGSETPAYSLRSRIDVKREILRPSYPKIPDSFGNGTPKWSLFLRLEERPFQPPGPTYIPPKLGTFAPKYSVTDVRKREIGQGLIPIGPGGGRHNTRPMTGSDTPKFTLKAREFPNNLGGPDGPGAGKYFPDFSRILPADLKGRAILERFREHTPEVRPGYRDLRGASVAPRWTIRPHLPIAVLKGSRL
jgi:hypothetical protein